MMTDSTSFGYVPGIIAYLKQEILNSVCTSWNMAFITRVYSYIRAI